MFRASAIALAASILPAVAAAQCPTEPSLGRVDWASEISGRGAPDEAEARIRARDLEQALQRRTEERPEQLRQLGEALRDVYRASGDRDALAESIRSLARRLQEYPEHDHTDRVLFLLAWGLDELDDHDRARQVHHRLIRHYPASPYVAIAYLAFGDHYFEEGDPRAAERFYDRGVLLQAGLPSAYAAYMRAWSLHRAGDASTAELERARRLAVGPSALARVIAAAIERDACRLR